MTAAQIISILLLAAVAVWAYIPSLLGGIRVPALTSKPAILKDIEAVVNIRTNSRSPDVVAACNQLLAVLLQVKP